MALTDEMAALKNDITAVGSSVRSKTGQPGALTLPQMAAEIQGIHTGVEPQNKTWDQRSNGVRRFVDEVEYTAEGTAELTFSENITAVNVSDPTKAAASYSGKKVTVTAVADGYTAITAIAGGVAKPFGAKIETVGNTKYISCIKGYETQEVQGNWSPAGASVDTSSGELTVADRDNGGTLTMTAGSGTTSIYNLTPNTESVFTEKKNSAITATGVLKPLGACRVIKTGSMQNVRDIGGWDCDGGTVRYNRIIRGYTLYNASSDDKKLLKDLLKIRLDVSLQYTSDNNYYGSSQLGGDVDFIHPCNSGLWYDEILQNTNAGTLFNAIFQAAANGKAQYIHCAQGADRTGTVMYIIESVLGMSESDKDKDFELTSYSAAERLRSKTDYIALKTAVNALSGSSVRNKLVKWLVSKGVTIELINAFRQAVIDGDPETLVVDPDPVTNLFDPETSIYNSRTGSDGSPKAAGERPGVLVTNPIPVDSSMGTLTISGITEVYRSDLQYCAKIVGYDSGNATIVQVAYPTETYTYDVAAALVSKPSLAKLRINLCLKESGISISTADTANLVISAQ